MKKMKFFILIRISKIGRSSNLIKKEVYRTSWVPSVFQAKHKVKTVERAYTLSKDKEECLLFRKKDMREFRDKGFIFIHLGLKEEF